MAEIILFITGFVAAFVGANTGGGGLISLPVLIFLGFPPQVAIATNRLAFLGGFTGAAARFNRHQAIDWQVAIPISIPAIIGSLIGTYSVLQVPPEAMEKAIAIMMLSALAFILINKKFGRGNEQKLNPILRIIGYFLFLLVGFIGSFFGAAGGILSSYVLLFFFGKSFIDTAGTRAVQGLLSTLASVIFFSFTNTINWYCGIIITAGMVVGAYIGAGYGLKKGNNWIKKLFAVIVVVAAVKLLI